MKTTIKYDIKVENGNIIINISKEDFIKLFSMNINNFCKEIDKIEEDAKSLYFTGRINER